MKTQHVDRHVTDRLGDHLEGDLSLAEFARVERHLAACSDCADELRELRNTVSLLRGLPDPEPPVELADAVMRRIESGEGRPRRVAPSFRRIADPRFAIALAAGVAGLMIFASSEFGTGDILGTPSELAPESIADVRDSRGDAGVPGVKERRPSSLPGMPAVVSSGSPAVVFAANASSRHPERWGFFGTALPEAPLRDLDGEIEALKADPSAFLERYLRTPEDTRGPVVAPLIEHFARRGDPNAVARTVSSVAARGPMAVPVSTR